MERREREKIALRREMSLKAGLRAYVEFGVQHPDHYRVALMTPMAPRKDDRDFRATQGWQTFQLLMRGVSRCIEAGRFRVDDVMAASQSLWTVVHGLTSAFIACGECFPWVDQNQLIDLTIDSAVRGMLA